MKREAQVLAARAPEGACSRPKNYRDSSEAAGFDPPAIYKTYMSMAVRKIKEAAFRIWNKRIAERSYSDRTDVTDRKNLQKYKTPVKGPL